MSSGLIGKYVFLFSLTVFAFFFFYFSIHYCIHLLWGKSESFRTCVGLRGGMISTLIFNLVLKMLMRGFLSLSAKLTTPEHMLCHTLMTLPCCRVASKAFFWCFKAQANRIPKPLLSTRRIASAVRCLHYIQEMLK